MAEQAEHVGPATDDSTANQDADSIRLCLVVADPELITELLNHPEGEPRDRYALTALRVGILCLKQAEGRLDAETIRHEGERLLTELTHALDEHRNDVFNKVSSSLQEYFDPKDGRLSERIERLISKDGELERFMQEHLGSQDSLLVKTLTTYLGETSPIMRMIAPENPEGFLNALSKNVDQLLTSSRETILAEFSLDSDQSALSRLVKRVEAAQGDVAKEFSLDNEQSALARMRRELLDILKQHKREADEFRAAVSERLATIAARREEAMRSTRHGEDYEEQVKHFVASECQKAGDICEDTSNATGMIKNSKVGDLVVELGPECLASGARIVVEAKESASYTLSKALDELEVARKNRAASVGLFVFSSLSAPPELEPMKRYGADIVVVWDPEDPQTDVFLRAGLSVARAICVQEAVSRRQEEIDLEPTERAIRAIEKLSNGLAEINTWSETIRSNSNKIIDRVRVMSDELSRQVSVLDEQVQGLKSELASRGE